jgi:hypothetical protein
LSKEGKELLNSFETRVKRKIFGTVKGVAVGRIQE